MYPGSRSNIPLVLAMMVTTALAFAANGDGYAVKDQLNYIPVIYKLLDPDLYSTDYFFIQSSGTMTVWTYAVSALARLWELQSIFLVGYVISLLAYLGAIYALAFMLCEDRITSLAAALIVVIFKPFGGIDPYFI